ncbi:uncharacterized protein LOC119355188 [Triticum dicoccoides]|uniref:uncharacterized protein LOC119355188 n=1 Tax=Triticum dicoccoides TaxID=85692 RepID=UPI00188EBD35|nr:uncharacterized protein LOC119355188 [Triticum dicoccoides]
MATGRAPWSGMGGDGLAALHRIGYTEAVPEVPQWLSADAKDFLARCLVRQAGDRCTVSQLLEHPFLASAGIVDAKPQAVESKSRWVSPKTTLDAAFWESESDTEEAEHESTAEMRMRALARPASALPDWDSDEGWIDVLSGPSEAVPVPAEETAELDDAITPCGEESGVLDAILVQYSSFVNAGEGYDDSVQQSCSTRHQSLEDSVSHELSLRTMPETEHRLLARAATGFEVASLRALLAGTDHQAVTLWVCANRLEVPYVVGGGRVPPQRASRLPLYVQSLTPCSR